MRPRSVMLCEPSSAVRRRVTPARVASRFPDDPLAAFVLVPTHRASALNASPKPLSSASSSPTAAAGGQGHRQAGLDGRSRPGTEQEASGAVASDGPHRHPLIRPEPDPGVQARDGRRHPSGVDAGVAAEPPAVGQRHARDHSAL